MTQAGDSSRGLEFEDNRHHTANHSQKRKEGNSKGSNGKRGKVGRHSGELRPPLVPGVSPPIQGAVTLAYPAQGRHLGPACASTQVDKQIIFSYQQLQSSHHIPGEQHFREGVCCVLLESFSRTLLILDGGLSHSLPLAPFTSPVRFPPHLNKCSMTLV